MSASEYLHYGPIPIKLAEGMEVNVKDDTRSGILKKLGKRRSQVKLQFSTLTCDTKDIQPKIMKAKVKEGWHDAGKICEVIGLPIHVNGMSWMPIVWEDEEDPDWFKSSGLEFIK